MHGARGIRSSCPAHSTQLQLPHHACNHSLANSPNGCTLLKQTDAASFGRGGKGCMEGPLAGRVGGERTAAQLACRLSKRGPASHLILPLKFDFKKKESSTASKALSCTGSAELLHPKKNCRGRPAAAGTLCACGDARVMQQLLDQLMGKALPSPYSNSECSPPNPVRLMTCSQPELAQSRSGCPCSRPSWLSSRQWTQAQSSAPPRRCRSSSPASQAGACAMQVGEVGLGSS